MIGIRTGRQIHDELREFSDYCGVHEWDDICFIPLSELKEQIRILKVNHIALFQKFIQNEDDDEYLMALNQVLDVMKG